MITPHAQARMQQRGIPPGVLDLLLSYGSVEHDHHGAVIHHFTKQARRRLERDIGREPVRRMHKYLEAYAVNGNDGTLIRNDAGAIVGLVDQPMRCGTPALLAQELMNERYRRDEQH